MTYRIKTTQEKFSEGLSLVRQEGGMITENGSFSVNGVKGNITFDGELLVINITDKSFLATDGMIESKLNEFFKIWVRVI